MIKCAVLVLVVVLDGVLGQSSTPGSVLAKCADDPDSVSCVKLQAARMLDRAYRTDSLRLFDLVTLERTPSAPEPPEEPLENVLPRDSALRDSALDKILLEKLWRYLETRTIKVDFPTDVFEGRKKGLKLKKAVKKGGLYMMMFGAMGASLVQLALGKVALIAGKALLISKVALLLAVVIGLKSLLSHSDKDQHSQQVIYAEPEAHGGWSRNSLQPDVAHDLAFRGQRSFRSGSRPRTDSSLSTQ